MQICLVIGLNKTLGQNFELETHEGIHTGTVHEPRLG